MSVKTKGTVTYSGKKYNLWQRERAIAHQAHIKNVIAATSDDLTLTANDTGALVTMDGSGGSSCIVTLPALEAGLNYHFVVKDLTAACRVTAPVNKLQGVIFCNDNGDDDAKDLANQGYVEIGTTRCAVGDWIKVESDGTNWYVSGASQGREGDISKGTV